MGNARRAGSLSLVLGVILLGGLGSGCQRPQEPTRPAVTTPAASVGANDATVASARRWLYQTSRTAPRVQEGARGRLSGAFRLRLATMGGSAAERALAALQHAGSAFGMSEEAMRTPKITEHAIGQHDIVRLQQLNPDGLPVLGQQIAVRLERTSGTITAIAGQFEPAASRTPVHFAIDSAAAVHAVAVAASPWAAARASATQAVLVTGEGDTARPTPVWVVQAGWPRSKRMRWYISGADGHVLAKRPVYRRLDRARAWPSDPGRDRTAPLQEVTLWGRDDPQHTGKLVGQRLSGFNCPDLGEINEEEYGFPAPVCTFTQDASADDNGDFFYTPTLDVYDASDKFAEVHAFHHAGRLLQYVETLGFQPRAGFRVGVVANYLEAYPENWDDPNCDPYDPTPDCRLVLAPMDNAMAGPGGPTDDYPYGVFIGQGELLDWSYDGSTVAHEMTHVVQFAMTEDLADDFLPAHDAYGINSVSGEALAEAFADYFAGAVTGAACAEYLADIMPCDDRNMDVLRKCPDDIIGESHDDSRIVSSALWAARKQLIASGFDAAGFDGAVLGGLGMTVTATTSDMFAEMMLAGVQENLGPDAEAQAREVMTGQGVIGCDRTSRALPEDVVPKFDEAAKPVMYLISDIFPPVPPLYQWRFDVADGNDPLYFLVSGFCPNGSWLPNFRFDLSSQGPITFEYGRVQMDPEPNDGDPDAADGGVASIVPVADAEEELPIAGHWMQDSGIPVMWFVLRDPARAIERAAGTYHAAMLSYAPLGSECWVDGVSLWHGPLPAAPSGGGTSAEPDGGAAEAQLDGGAGEAQPDQGAASHGGGGCSMHGARGGSAGPLLAMLACSALCLVRARRRRCASRLA
jgi:hypothetical protein